MKSLIKKFIPKFLFGWYHFSLAFLGAVFYGFPSRKMTVIGVTGTNGKTTTVHLIAAILEEAGFKTAVLSSMAFKIGQSEELNRLKMTMPGRFFIQKFLRKAASAGCQFAVLEVTSEGISQHRHRFINFKAAVFTNLSPEHIERHGSFEKYREAKGKFFQAVKGVHIINLDDPNAEYFLQFLAEKKYGYTISGDAASNYGGRTSIIISIISAKDIQPFNLKLPGDFNVSNALAAIGAGLSQGVSLEACKAAVEKVQGIPGRMEEVVPSPFKVIVDYAFTPNALEKVYEALTSKPANQQTSKLICVLGAAGGGRDKWKRPVLGRIAAKYCGEIIITNEDPYDEDPMKIIEEVAKGAGAKARKILDRREAIKESLGLANPGDTVIITGKGSEPLMCLAKDKKIPWDEAGIVREELKNLIS